MNKNSAEQKINVKICTWPSNASTRPPLVSYLCRKMTKMRHNNKTTIETAIAKMIPRIAWYAWKSLAELAMMVGMLQSHKAASAHGDMLSKRENEGNQRLQHDPWARFVPFGQISASAMLMQPRMSRNRNNFRNCGISNCNSQRNQQ